MAFDFVTGTSTRGAVIRGLLLGLVLQALLIGAVEVTGPPINSDLVAVARPAVQPAAPVVALARPQR